MKDEVNEREVYFWEHDGEQSREGLLLGMLLARVQFGDIRIQQRRSSPEIVESQMEGETPYKTFRKYTRDGLSLRAFERNYFGESRDTQFDIKLEGNLVFEGSTSVGPCSGVNQKITIAKYIPGEWEEKLREM